MITGIEFAERLYSSGEYSFEERRFGLLGGIRKAVTVIKNTGKSILNPKKYLYEDPINSALSNRYNRFNRGLLYSPNSNQAVSSNLDKIAKENNISVIRGVPDSDFITDSKSLMSKLIELRNKGKITPLQLREFRNIIMNGEGVETRKIIALVNKNPSENPEILAHELGHYLNSKSKGLSGLISRGSKLSGGLNFRSYYGKVKGTELRDKDGLPSIKEQIKRSIGSRLVEAEEKNASTRAIRLLKQSGMDNDQLDIARSNLRSSYNTYKNDGIIYRKYMNYRRFFQPKSDWKDNNFVNPPININYL